MSDPIYYAAQAVLPALIIVVVLWRRQARQGVALGFVKWMGVYVIALISCAACIVGLEALSRALGLQNGKWVVQLLWLVSTLIGYLVGGRAVVRFRGKVEAKS